MEGVKIKNEQLAKDRRAYKRDSKNPRFLFLWQDQKEREQDNGDRDIYSDFHNKPPTGAD